MQAEGDTDPEIDRLSDRLGGVELEWAHLGLGLSEVTVASLWKPLSMEESLERDKGLVKQSQVSEHTHLQDTPIHWPLEVTTYEGRKVLVQGQQWQNLDKISNDWI